MTPNERAFAIALAVVLIVVSIILAVGRAMQNYTPPTSAHPYPAHGTTLAVPQPADGWAQYAVATPHTDPWIQSVVACESGGAILARNPTSSASGRYQFIDSTWEAVTGRPAPAFKYPLYVQQEAFDRLWDGGRGASHWECA